MLESIYNIAVYFKNVYEKWILEPLVKEIIADDKSIYSVTDRTDKKYISYI